MEADKKSGNAKNQDIRSFFNNNNKGNKRAIKAIEPYLEFVNEDSYKFRDRKIINYKDEFDLSSVSSGKEENEINNSLEFDTTKKFTKIKRLRKKKGLIKKKKKGIVKKSDSICSHEFFEDDEGNMTKRSIYDKFDYIELRNVKNFSKIKTDIQKTISEANQEIKKLEKEFFINEHNISITKSRFPDDCIPVNADIRTFNWQVKYYLLLEIS